MIMRHYILAIFFIAATPIMAEQHAEVEEILVNTFNEAKAAPGSYKKVALVTVEQLLPYPKQVVTKALYEQLLIGGPIVARLARDNRLFDPDLWMDLTIKEQDRYIKMKALGTFNMEPRPSSEDRFIALLKECLKDTREGVPPIGDEERAYTDTGLRVCDIAYNKLMSRRPEAVWPGVYPLDTVGDSVTTRDRFITEMCAELGVSGPTSPDAIHEPASAIIPTPNTRQSNGNESIKDRLQTPSWPTSKMLWLAWSATIIAAIGLLWLLLKKRK